ncbi:PP2C family protein-serine/threonine phosphatase [Xylanimonas ulmi]|uniref:Stage II sporulation protein E n=1 Tax=Xylanimonas ulmi TaxID=228973 RepID=A0A4Q7M5K1_9MICO|nr:PP2C family protein-serine/threonine phosphatase [Xylanibacterium ulmi]RZS61309.1 stage II sporulation protein E [Xylanibacterium ulmi]
MADGGVRGPDAAWAGAVGQVVLLVEGDDHDALLVAESLGDAGLDVELRRVRSVREAESALARGGVDCLLVGLGAPGAAESEVEEPDATEPDAAEPEAIGADAVGRLRAACAGLLDPPALVVLTDIADQGASAVAAGADDHLSKDEADPVALGRSLRYALQGRRTAAQERALSRGEVRAAEAERLERALVPTPLVADRDVSVMVGYLPGRDGLLGGDFFDAIERADAAVMCVIGDVAGHGPDEAALGARLRTAWRTLVLSDTPADRTLPLLERVLISERASAEVFVTLCQVVVMPGRDAVEVYLAGHVPPLLITGPVGAVEVRVLDGALRGRALGVPVEGGWRAQRVELTGPFSVALYTDGLVEAQVGPAAAGDGAGKPLPRAAPRLGVPGLRGVLAAEVSGDFCGLVERVLRRVRDLHGGPLADDAALLVVGWTGSADVPGERSSTLADSAEWAR